MHARHDVIHGRLGDPAPAGTDVWMHGIAIEGSPPMAEPIAAQLLASPASIAVFQLCDGECMSFERIPPDVMAQARLFLRNHWPRDRSHLPVAAETRTGWMPPMLKPMAPHPGKPLAERAVGAVFYGTRRDSPTWAAERTRARSSCVSCAEAGWPFKAASCRIRMHAIRFPRTFRSKP